MGISIPLRHLLLAALMVAASLLAHALTPTRQLAREREAITLEDAVPRAFAAWRVDPGVQPILPSPETQENLDRTYDQVLSRTYVNREGQRMMLTIAYGGLQNREFRAHRQEVCYSAQGFRISDLEPADLVLHGRTVQATRMLATHGSRREPVTYWFTMGDEVVRSLVGRQIVEFRYALEGYIPDGYLVRVSALSADPARSFDEQQAFMTELFSHLDGRLQRRLLGAPS